MVLCFPVAKSGGAAVVLFKSIAVVHVGNRVFVSPHIFEVIRYNRNRSVGKQCKMKEEQNYADSVE